jgi:DNA-binding NarL/FixJ family response regulator
MNIRLLLVDDDERVRSDLAGLIAREDGLSVVGQAGSSAEALAIAAETQPHVVMTEAILPDGSGAELCRSLRATHLGLQVLLVTSLPADAAFVHASMGGAAGYLLKPIRQGEVVDAIRRVAEGERLLDTALMGRILSRLLEGPDERDLTLQIGDQEKRILVLVAEGLTDPEIAERMGLEPEDVKRRVSTLLTKLGIPSNTPTGPRD